MDIQSPEILNACSRLGWSHPRPSQVEVLGPILDGKDVLAILPTSAGKSAAYQLPALARDGLVVVISPLVALMADQVARLRSHGVNAHMLNSHCSVLQKKTTMEDIREGKADLLYISPERLQGLHPSSLGGSKIQLFAIDEAHCISEWGHDFRPAYLRVGKSLARFGGVQKLALTATATTDVANEIVNVLHIDDSAKIVHSPNRSNITYGVAGSKVNLVRLVQNVGTPCLVYGSTRRSVENGALQLKRSGFRTGYYHAGMGRKDRMEVQERFASGDFEVITATCAFGMGIDHPGIRSVVHLEMPTSLEAYMQESGRAGRDGSPSFALCRATVDTLDVAVHLSRLTWPEPYRVRTFWDNIQELFKSKPGKATADGSVQVTNAFISMNIEGSFEPIEVGSCLRILSSCGAIRRVPYQERPVSVDLLSARHRLTGSRQKAVIRALDAHADVNGNVTGSVRFFRDEVDLDISFAKELNLRGAIRFDWVPNCQMIEITTTSEPEIEDDQLDSMRRRAMNRISYTRGYLTTPKCRREYLLEYFGDTSGGTCDGLCCDRCKSRAEA